MDTTTRVKPKTMAELLPGLSGILSKGSSQADQISKKQLRQTIAQTHESENAMKPLTVAEMRADIWTLRDQSRRGLAGRATFSNNKSWNSSVRVDHKNVSYTAIGQLKNNPVRKVLNFQVIKPKSISKFRATMTPGLPNFPKPEFKAKKSFHFLAHDDGRIDNAYNVSKTPINNMPIRNRMTLGNKENVSNQSDIKKISSEMLFNHNKKTSPQLLLNHEKLEVSVTDTPLSVESRASSSDASFLQNENDINNIEEKRRALSKEEPHSIPYKEYGNVQDFFHHSSDIDDSATSDLALPSIENKRKENAIVSLCDLLNKTTVNTQKSTELEDLVQIEKQTKNNIKMVENSIATLKKIKASQLNSLQSLRKMIKDKNVT